MSEVCAWLALAGLSGIAASAETAQTVTGPSGSGGESVTVQLNDVTFEFGFAGTEQTSL